MPVKEPLPVILNPAASAGAGRRLKREVEEELRQRGVEFRMSLTEGPGHATTLAEEAARRGAERILAVGGDGTVHEVVNGILRAPSDPPSLAVVPVGTGNDFYRMVGPRRRAEAALDAVTRGRTRRFDVGWVRFDGGESHFVNLLGVGVDVELLRRRNGFRHLRGLPQYLAALVSALVRFRPEALRVTLHQEGEKGEVFQDRTILSAVTVGPSVAGGFMLNPRALPDDGLLDLFFVRQLGMARIARYIPRVIRGTHEGIPEIRQRQIREAVMERPDGGTFYFEMDGELVPHPTRRLEIGIREKTLPVLLPATGPSALG